MKPRFACAAVAVLFSMCFAMPAAAAAPGPQCLPWPQVEAMARQRAATVWVAKLAGSYEFQGSGVLLSGGLVLTNQHVVSRGLTYRVDAGGVSQWATVIRADEGMDVALLRLHPPRALPPLPRLETTAKMPVRESPVVMWSSLQGSVARSGQVWEDNTLIRSAEMEALAGNLYATQFLGVYGDSGSGVYDCRGHLVGLKTAITISPEAQGSAGPLVNLPDLSNPQRFERLRNNARAASYNFTHGNLREGYGIFVQLRQEGHRSILLKPAVLQGMLCLNAAQAVSGCGPFLAAHTGQASPASGPPAWPGGALNLPNPY